MLQSRDIRDSITAVDTSIVLDVESLATLAVDIRGTFTATLQFEATVDGENWFSINLASITSFGQSSSVTTAGAWWGTVAAYQKVRVRCSAYTSGTISVVGRAISAGGLEGLLALAFDSTNNWLDVGLGNALSKGTDSIESRPEGTTYSNKTASANAIRSGSGILVGMYVNSTSAGTIKIYDSLTQAGDVINNTITPAIGYHPLGNASFSTGLSVTIGGTALDVTLYYIPTS